MIHTLVHLIRANILKVYKKMKLKIHQILPKTFIEFKRKRRLKRILVEWDQRNFLGYSPQIVKEKIFSSYGISGANWIETGTYMGVTTNFLRKNFPYVYSIEPSYEYYSSALKRFEGKNVTLFNDLSENVLPELLPKLEGNINFWLDGHYSGGNTFKGISDCPIIDELSVIKKNFHRYNKLCILIDDVRLFSQSNKEYSDYPSIDYLVDWARGMKMIWHIEHDIFIMRKN